MGFFDDNGWVRNGLATQIGRAEQEYAHNRDIWQGMFDQGVNGFMRPGMDAYNQFGLGNTGNLSNNVFNFDPTQLMRDSGMFMTPEMQANNQNIGQYAYHTQNPLYGKAQNTFQNDGWNPFFEDNSNTIKAMMSPGNNPALSAQLNQGQNLLNSQGQDPFTQGYQGMAMNALASGGMTPQAQVMGNVGADILQSNPLMSPEQAASFAANVAGTNFKNAAEATMAKAVARGAAPGSVVASGLGNEVMADFADAGMNAQSKAVMDALMQQQALGLQRWNQAGDLVGGSGNLANQNLSTMGNFGLGAGSQQNERMGLGANLLGNANQLQLGGVNAMGNLLANQNQFALGSGQLASNTGMNIANSMDKMFQNNLGAGGLGVQRGANLIQGNLGALNAQQNFLNSQNQAFGQNVLGPWSQLMNYPSQAALTSLGAITGGIPVGQGGPNQGLLSKIGQTGQIAGGLMGLIP